MAEEARGRRLLREPLVHFLLLAAAIFGVNALLRGAPEPDRPRILVPRGEIEAMASGFARTWHRPPSREELDALVEDRVREEILCREAVALGLDRDDTILRRRLRQKMEFLLEDAAALGEPSAADLEAFLAANAGRFRPEARFTFRQVFLDHRKRGAALARDAAALLEALARTGADPDAAGDPTLLPPLLEGEPRSGVVARFGEPIAAALDAAEDGQWAGPFVSTFGSHLLLRTAVVREPVPPLERIRDAVAREWTEQRRRELVEKVHRDLRERYEVIVEDR